MSDHKGRLGHLDFSWDGELPTLREGPLPVGTVGFNVTVDDSEPEWPDTIEGRVQKWMYDYEDASGCYDAGLCYQILADNAKEIIEQLRAEKVTT